jgi:membrane-associated protease RseP (regulator of RpoE activity)
MGLVVLWLFERAWVVLWTFLSVQTARLVGFPVHEVAIGTGPTRAVGVVDGVVVRIGALPLGGWVRGPEDRVLPLAVASGPALLLGSLAGAFAPVSVTAAVLRFVVPMLSWGRPEPGGLLGALALAGEHALLDPLGTGLALAGVLGVQSAVLSSLGQLARLGPGGVAVYVLAQAYVLACVIRVLVLDLG